MRWVADRRGAVAIAGAVSMALFLALAAVAVDLGWMFMQSRKLQGVADLAAMAAARDLERAEAAAAATVAQNGWDGPVDVELMLGTWSADPALEPAKRFKTVMNGRPDAVKVTLRAPTELFFGQFVLGERATTLTRTATAARADLAGFSIGSGLLALDEGVANTLLQGLTGSQLRLSLMDYQALASADVNLLGYMQALKTDLGLEAASFEKALDADVSMPRALTVLSQVLSRDGQGRAAAAAAIVAAASHGAPEVRLGRLLDLGPYAGQDRAQGGSAAAVSLAALDVMNGLLGLANGGRQVKLDLGAQIAGLSDVDVWLAVGERPNDSAWMAVTDDDTVIVRTAQTRLYVEAKVLANGLLGALGVTSITVPLFVEIASAEARLSGLSCALDRAQRRVDLSVKPSVGRMAIATVDKTKLNDFKQPLALTRAQLVQLLLLKIGAYAKVDIGGATWLPVGFTQADIDQRRMKTVATQDVLSATAGSLLGNLDLTVDLGPIPLVSTALVTSALNGLLQPLGAPLDALLNSLTGLLGVKLGKADVRVNGLRCGAGALVA